MENPTQSRPHDADGGPAAAMAPQDSDIRELTHVECWKILGDSGIGHLALRAQPVGVDIMPINYLVNERQLFFRSAPGTKLEDIVLHPHVAIQIERLQEGRWFSVVLKGTATRLAADDDIEVSGILHLVPAQPGDKFNYVRIIPDAITGRTFAAR
ncbi:pyridoxamine 5'-phosphate oxidase family protein [Leifsonia sp. Root112D2]|uniref:pyridoxamine 5'-phosphate oxidase family protein n=1 Tax=Leifsonia sp. Root112D2 TaxID=1736426 RepID=UPI000ADC3352|nr:pyridoxamine 5'-phosphate oxidase family protein [Leifsonia sp. Root112D2]